MPTEVDVAIVGAGAAGIAAARRLGETHLSFVVIEASGRAGGRAWTRDVDGMALDLGCGWLHSADRNPWTRIAEQSGQQIDRTPPAWGRQYEELGFTSEEQEAANDAFEAFDNRLRDRPPPSDCAADALDSESPWRAYIEARSGYINGVGLAKLSVADYLAYEAADSAVNWRLPGGYGALILGTAADLDILFDTRVTSIDAGARLILTTSAGTMSARAAIVAVPTSVLANGSLRLPKSLDPWVEAAAALPLGLANKLFLALDDAGDLAHDTHLLGNPRRAETGSYYLRPFGRPVIEAFFGGAGAEGLETGGLAGMADFAAEELGALFGSSFRRRLRPLAASA